MLKQIEGLVLRTVDYSESSVICDLFSRELGRRSYMVHGVRKPKAKITKALLRPMSWVELVVYHNEERDLNKVKEIRPSYIYQIIPFDIARSNMALFMVELAQKGLQEEGPQEELYNFLWVYFNQLDQKESPAWANLHLHFMVHFSAELGFCPSPSTSPIFDYKEGEFVQEKPLHPYHFDEESSQILDQLLRLGRHQLAELKLNRIKRQHFIEQMILFYRYHLPNFQLKSWEVLKQIMG
ncbi:DNA repair protein RecO [Saprospira grandis DSM 2844]|uniref:DNA repair protein RecO n=1 Tax=Saprospira grandis DSM 2844 TaxID=694433 RepID=J0NY88_9BACT|nr:DNA repair protein RecO [Saprospira grandis]EJF52484.1 DNA repair protein RecO [Saprospira grandis DSM 2844]